MTSFPCCNCGICGKCVRKVKKLPRTFTALYLSMFTCSAVFGALVFTENGTSQDDLWVICFGIATILSLIVAALLLVEPPTKERKRYCRNQCCGKSSELESGDGRQGSSQEDEDGSGRRSDGSGAWCGAFVMMDVIASELKANHNANRVFVLLEALFDSAIAVDDLGQGTIGSIAYDVSICAACAAVASLLCVLVDLMLYCRYYAEIEFVRSLRSTEPLWEAVEAKAQGKNELALRCNEKWFRQYVYPIHHYAFIWALILSDLADILLLSRSIVLLQFDTKDLLVFVFLLSNVLVSEIFTGVANLFESFGSGDDDNLQYEVEELAAAASLRSSLRTKANVQCVVTGLLMVPLVLATTLLASARLTIDGFFTVFMPFFALFLLSWIVQIPEFFGTCGASIVRFTSACLFKSTRIDQLVPRLLAGIWAIVLAYTDVITLDGLDGTFKRTIFEMYAVYIFVPLAVRLISELARGAEILSKLRTKGDFKGRQLTHTDHLCIGSYASSSHSLKVSLEMVYPSQLSLNLLWFGLSSWTPGASDGTVTGQDADTTGNQAPSLNGIILRLNTNLIGRRGALVISNALLTNRCVASLWLNTNQLGVDGAGLLAKGLRTNVTLKSLFLDENSIGVEGAKELATALKNTTDGLRVLSLGANNIGNAGLKAIGDALSTNESLTELNLSKNTVGSARHNRDDEELDDEGDVVEGFAALVAGISANRCRLCVLDLEDNQVNDKDAESLETLGSKLRVVKLRSNAVSPRMADNLRAYGRFDF